MPEDFKEHLERALVVVRDEVPELSAALANAIGTRVIEIQVDGSPFRVEASGGGVALRTDACHWDAYGSASGQAIDALLRGETTMEDAVLDGQVTLRGDLEDLVALDRALRLFVQCAVRAPGVLPILRSWNEREGDER